MFFLQKLSTLGKVIYFGTIVLDVIVLLILSMKYPGGQFLMKFGVFAAIWLVGSVMAMQVSRKK